MLGHYQRLLESVTANPDARLNDLEILTAAERAQLLVDWNATTAVWQTPSVLTLFDQQVARTPDALAVEFEDEQLSFRELDKRANQLAQHLRKLGFGPESRAGIASQLSFIDLHGLSEDYLRNYVARVYALTPADIQRMAKTYIDPSKLAIVVVGDPAVVREQIKTYGDILQ